MTSSERAYPVEVWQIRERSLDPGLLARGESVFSLGNGYLGMRGNFEEGSCNSAVGTFINGFYEEEPITYGETAYGYAKDRQVMLNIADGRLIQLFVDGEPFDMSTGQVLEYERILDMRAGTLERAVRWRAPGGAEIAVRTRRLVSHTRRSLAVIEYSARILRGGASLRIESSLDCTVTNQVSGSDPRIGTQLSPGALALVVKEAGERSGAVLQRTRNSGLAVACAMEHDLHCGTSAVGPCEEPGRATVAFEAAGDGAVIHLTKYLAYVTTFEHPEAELVARARGLAREGMQGFEALASEQRACLDRFWSIAEVELDGDEAIRQGLHFNLFQLLQSAGRDGRTSIAAKGLSGEGYEGHYFWDSEIYALPFFIYTQPEIAGSLLRFRCGILDEARARAAELNQRGALMPWRTISGKECSAYYPAGTAQYHINADVVYAFRKYLGAVDDPALLLEGGAELVFETARLWADLGHFNPEKGGAFCIDAVTGPDEYTALVDNNLYTNLMARMNLRYAVELARHMQEAMPEAYRRIADAISLEEPEISGWSEAAERMYIPFDAGRGIHLQDDRFLSRKPWDFEHTPEAKYPLLLHFHPLVIYRHQVLKQPDVVLAQVLLGDQFSMAEKRRNFEFYDPLTTGDSSLSACIQSIAVAELGRTEQAYAYFTRTARMDLDDVNGDTARGLHMAAMGGTWMSVVYGFAGMRDQGGMLSFAPRLPERWTRLRFRILHRGRLLDIAMTHQETAYRLLEGGSMTFSHRGHGIELKKGQTLRVSNMPRLECVIFDLDGVVTDSAECHFQAWSRLASELGLPFDRGVNERLKGVSRQESLEIILAHGGVAMTPKEKERLTDRKNAHFLELIETLGPEDLLPGIPELLKALRGAGIKTALASMSHNARRILARLGIGPLFDAIVDPAAIAKGKPDPEIFLTAAETLGIPAENCAGVEDAVAGIQAIQAAGMFAVGIGSGLTGADWLLPDTRELTLEALQERFSERTFSTPNPLIVS